MNAGVVVSEDVTKHSGLRQDHLMNAPQPEAALSMFLQFVQGSVLLAFQTQETIGFITQAAKRAHLSFQPAYVDIENLCRMLYPDFQSYRIGAIAKELERLNAGLFGDAAEYLNQAAEALRSYEIYK